MNAPASNWPLPFWIAHRGAGKLAPENTMAAFRLGAAHGYRAFECDVKLSADGVPFLLHDATLDRTTAARGPAAARTWSELSRVDAGSWHSRAYAGEPPASLDALTAWLHANHFALDLEIKPSPGEERRTGEVVGAYARSQWSRPDSPPLLFTSFKPDALRGAQSTAPEVPRGLLLDTLWQGWEAVADELEVAAVVTNYAVMEAALVQSLHAQGRRALVYTVNDPSVATWLQGIGIDGIVTDAVDRFSPAG
jgi:glycerophosphoryl diester phosphodiesterase